MNKYFAGTPEETSQAKEYMKDMYIEMLELQKNGKWHNRCEEAFRCKKCGEWLPPYTKGQLHYCKCKSLAIDGTPYYTRLLGDMNECDFEEIKTVLEDEGW